MPSSNFDDGIGKSRDDLRLGRPPGKFDVHVDVFFGKKPSGDIDQFGGNFLSFEIFERLDIGIAGHGNDPSGRPLADLGIDKIADQNGIGLVFHCPVLAGDAGVQHAAFDVPGHLLGPAD